MCKEEMKINLVDNIMGYLKYELLLKLEEQPNSFTIFNSVLDLMQVMNKYSYSYTLKDIDDLLFEKLIGEITRILCQK